jgi:pimeloyl-ACP methyl ester carboxylesterase
MEARRKSRGMRGLRILLRIVVGAVIVVLMLRWFEHRQVYHPSRTLDADGRELGRAVEEVTFEASDGVQLHAWFFPAQPVSSGTGYVWLLCHGNGGNISHRLGHAAALLNTGAAVLLFDYRGYGRSRGRPGEAGTYLDAQAAYRWLVGRGYEGRRILVLGESLGGAVGAELSLREKVGGLVLLATFTSVPDLGAELFPWLPVRKLCTIEYATVDKLQRVQVPVMVVHSPEDSLVGMPHAQANYAAIPGPKLFWTIGGDHNDFLEDAARYTEGLRRFLELVTASQPAP